MWNSEVGQSRPRGPSRHSGRAQSTPRCAPPPPERQWPQHSWGHAGSSLGIVSRALHSLCVGGSLSHFPEEVEAGRGQLATAEQDPSLGLVAPSPVLGPLAS